jgi:hypothetical protein
MTTSTPVARAKRPSRCTSAGVMVTSAQAGGVSPVEVQNTRRSAELPPNRRVGRPSPPTRMAKSEPGSQRGSTSSASSKDSPTLPTRHALVTAGPAPTVTVTAGPVGRSPRFRARESCPGAIPGTRSAIRGGDAAGSTDPSGRAVAVTAGLELVVDELAEVCAYPASLHPTIVATIPATTSVRSVRLRPPRSRAAPWEPAARPAASGATRHTGLASVVTTREFCPVQPGREHRCVDGEVGPDLGLRVGA